MAYTDNPSGMYYGPPGMATAEGPPVRVGSEALPAAGCIAATAATSAAASDAASQRARSSADKLSKAGLVLNAVSLLLVCVVCILGVIVWVRSAGSAGVIGIFPSELRDVHHGAHSLITLALPVFASLQLGGGVSLRRAVTGAVRRSPGRQEEPMIHARCTPLLLTGALGLTATGHLTIAFYFGEAVLHAAVLGKLHVSHGIAQPEYLQTSLNLLKANMSLLPLGAILLPIVSMVIQFMAQGRAQAAGFLEFVGK